MKTNILFIIAIYAMTFCSCTHNHGIKEGHEHEEENPFAVHFDKEMQKKVDFSIAKVEKRNIGSIIETVAQVQASSLDETIICAKTDGMVSLKNRALAVGSTINTGQAICTINASATTNNNLSAQQQQAQAEYQRAKAEYKRLQSLREEQLALESDVANAKAAMESALAQVKALQNGFAGGYQNVTATTSGYLKQLLVKDGQFIQAGQEIAIITKTQTLQLKAEVPVSYFSILKDIYDANIILPSSCEEYDHDSKTINLLSLGGKMLGYGHQTSTSSPLVPITFEIKNIINLVPGTLVNMFIKTKSTEEKLCVPSVSIIEEMGNWFVYVQTSEEHFEKRQVEIGANDGQYTEIRSGLTTAEKVVAHGAMLVKLQQAAGNVDPEAGHSHSH